MKFPYGISDFKTIITEDYFYCDRTGMIPLLEQSKSQLFIRPRRFGKSLLLSMLASYYDIGQKENFHTLFNRLKIGEQPTESHSAFYILKLDFSCVDPTGNARDIKKSLFNHINARIDRFCGDYSEKFNLRKIKIDTDDALFSMESLLNAVRLTPPPVCLLIDEYDNFANTVMMGVGSREERYESLVHDQGPLKTFFKAVKASTAGSMFARVFITGVSPVVLSDITSGYNIAKNIYFEPEFNKLCGFTEEEIEAVVAEVTRGCGLDALKAREAMDLMKVYYNGYLFSNETTINPVYNPTLALYFLEQFQKTCTFPKRMLDANLAADEDKLEYIANIPEGSELIMDLLEKDHSVTVTDITDRFGMEDLLRDDTRDNRFLVSFLYYFGVLTIAGETPDLKTILRVPNLVMKSLYVERMARRFLPAPRERDQGKTAAEQVYTKGEIGPLCRFVEKKYFKVFHNRDYRWANELTVKTAFLTLLYNDLIFIMDSESELDRRYADLVMIIRPDKRQARVFDVLIEFTFISLKKAGISSRDAAALSREELWELPEIKASLAEGKKQVNAYGEVLENRYKNLRLKKFVVVSLGFDRICSESY